jgi:hypothetical protein
MNHKKIILLVAVIALAVVAYFIIFKKSISGTVAAIAPGEQTGTATATGNVLPAYTGPTEISADGVVIRSNLGVPVSAPAVTPIIRSTSGRPV